MRDFDRRKPRAVASDANSFIGRCDRGAGLAHHIQRGLQQLRTRVLQQHVAAGHRHSHRIGAGLDPVGQNRMPRAVQLRNAFNHDARSAGARNLRAHLVEAIGDIADFRLARRILNDGRAVGERCGHDRSMRAANRHFRKNDLAAAQTFWCARDDIAAFDLDFGAEFLQRHDKQIDRTRADGAAARH